MTTNYSIALKAFRESKEYASAERAMITAGMKHPYVDNILTSAFEKGWNYSGNQQQT